jgi:predicted DNA-binding transcriptional regulator YafY
MSENFSKQEWFTLYQTALVELQQALIAGRIAATRTEIEKRMEALQGLPVLHDEERHAIVDALRALRLIEREEAREAAQTALEKLESIRPAIERLRSE